MNAVLLPRLDAAIPRALKPVCVVQREAALVEYLGAAGLLSGLDLPPQWSNPVQAVEGALTRWINGATGPLQLIQPGFALEVDSTNQQVLATCYVGDCPVFEIGAALLELEQASPGVGAAALAALTNQFCYPLYGPPDALHSARIWCWQGEDDEQCVLQQASNAQERTDLLADMVRRADFARRYPAWAAELPVTSLGAAQWRALQRMDGRTGRCAALVPQVLALTRQLARWDGAHPQWRDNLVEEDGMFFGYGGLLLWPEDDVTVRLYDMEQHYAMEGDCYDWTTRHAFALDQPALLGQWLARLRLQIELLRALDALLVALLE